MIHKGTNIPSKISPRMFILAWLLFALLGWTVTLFSIDHLTKNDNYTIETNNVPSPEDAFQMEKIIPTAGPSGSNF